MLGCLMGNGRLESFPLRDLEVRPAGEADFEGIYQIIVSGCGSYTVGKLLEDRYGKINKKSWEIMEGERVVSECWRWPDWVLVVEKKERIVGYATWRQDETIGLIGNTEVHPDLQRRGVGVSLISAVVDCLKVNGVRLLEVSRMAHDLPARQAYSENGFKEIGSTILLSRLQEGSVEETQVTTESFGMLAQLEAAGWSQIAILVHYELAF